MTILLNDGKHPRPVSIMGILNLTPDSFYEGSRCSGKDQALIMAERYVDEGADILDLGAESTRPGSRPITVAEELERLLPVLTKLQKRVTVPVSVDTYKPEVAKIVLAEGAQIINDITGLQKYPDMAKTIARFNASVVIMHMKGTPDTMQDNPRYEDLFGEIMAYLQRSVEIAEEAGIDPEKISVDPGIGFGKTSEDNLALIAGLRRFEVLNKPILLGASRKSFIGKVLGGISAGERLEGSLATAIFGALNGASVLRVHDVGPTVNALKMIGAIQAETAR